VRRSYGSARLVQPDPALVLVKHEKRHELLGRGERAVLADEAAKPRLDSTTSQREGSLCCHHEIADARTHTRSHPWPEPSRRDSLVPAQNPRSVAQHPLPDVKYVVDSARSGVDMSSAGLSPQHSGPLRQQRLLVEVDTIIRPDCHHAVVGRDHEHRLRGKPVSDPGYELIHVRQLVALWIAAGSVDVAENIEITVVRIAECSLPTVERVQDSAGEVAQGVRPAEAATS
jgi:hypothetical protein